MELDDLKRSWTEFDNKLDRNLKFNESLLRKMNMNTAKREFQKPLNIEIVNIVVAFLVIIYVSSMSIKFISELRFSIPGLLAVFVVFVYLYFSIRKANRFLKIDYFQSSVVKLQKEIAGLNQLVLRFRKYEFGMGPVLVLFLFPIIFKAYNKIDIYKHVWLFIIAFVSAVSIGVIGMILINKFYVDKKMKNVNRLLEEIVKFEKE